MGSAMAQNQCISVRYSVLRGIA